jgi:hypothetical protein
VTENQHRDLVFSGLFHFHSPSAGRLRAEIVGGPSVVREDTLQRTAFQIGPAVPITRTFGPYRPETSFTRWTIGLTGGIDLSAQIRKHLSIVPQFRMHWIQRADRTKENGTLGLSSLVVRPAIGVRASF